MEGDYKQSGYDPKSADQEVKMYTYYHQQDYLLTALTEANLKLMHIEQLPSPENASTQTTDMVLIARKV
jgi:hypothetical protein